MHIIMVTITYHLHINDYMYPGMRITGRTTCTLNLLHIKVDLILSQAISCMGFEEHSLCYDIHISCLVHTVCNSCNHKCG